MATDLEQFNAFLDEMSTTFGVAQVAKGVGLPVGAQLEADVASLTGEVAYRLGLGDDFFAVPETAGLIPVGSAVASRVGAASKWLGARSGAWLRGMRNNLGLIITLGGLYIGYSFATEDERVRIEEINARKELAQAGIAANPKKAQEILDTFGERTLGGVPFSTLALVALGLAGLWIGFRFYEASR